MLLYFFLSVLSSVMANVISHRINKWFYRR